MVQMKVLIIDDYHDYPAVAGTGLKKRRLFHDHRRRNGSEAGYLPMTDERMGKEVVVLLWKRPFREKLE